MRMVGMRIGVVVMIMSVRMVMPVLMIMIMRMVVAVGMMVMRCGHPLGELGLTLPARLPVPRLEGHRVGRQRIAVRAARTTHENAGRLRPARGWPGPTER